MRYRHLPILLLAAGLTFASQATLAKDLSIAATAVPHAEILEHIKPKLKKEDVNLKIKVFSDYIQPNAQVAGGHMDANFFQTRPFLKNFNQQHNHALVEAGAVHIEPMGAYSHKIKSLDELKKGATIAIPSSPANSGRALLLLQKQGLIKLKDPKDVSATSRDILDNPKHLKFKEMESATLPRVLDDVDLALINTNFALQAGLNPKQDALFMEGKKSPFVNVVAVPKGDKDKPAIKKLMQALHDQDTRDFIKKKYQGAIVPTF